MTVFIDASAPAPIVQERPFPRASLVSVEAIVAHPDPGATNLEVVFVDSSTYVVRKGQFTVGDIGILIQPDSVVPQTDEFRFVWEQKGYFGGLYESPIPEKYRRVTPITLRGVLSEGILLPIWDFIPYFHDYGQEHGCIYIVPTTDVSEALGIEPYVPWSGWPDWPTWRDKPRPKYPQSFGAWVKFLRYKIGTFLKPLDRKNRNSPI